MLSGTDMKLENYFSNIYVPEMKNKKKGSLILVTTQIEFNLKCLAQCICSKSSGLTFFDIEQIWKLYSKTVIISHTNLFKNAILCYTQLQATTLMKLY